MPQSEAHILHGEALHALPYAGRIELVEALMSLQPATVEELASFLGRDANTLYHHLRPLLRVGVVLEAGKRSTARRPATLYRLPAGRLKMDPEDRSPEALEARKKFIRTLLRETLRRQEKGLDDPDLVLDGERPTLVADLRIARLKPESHARVVRLLHELNELMMEAHDPDGEPFVLTYQLSKFG